MKTFLLVGLLIASAAAFTADEQEFMWEAFKIQHNKKYTSAFDAMKRFAVFKKNLDFIASHNADETQTYKVAMNHMGDMTSEEYKNNMLGLKKRTVRRVGEKLSTVGLPTSIDWSAKGAVTPIKNQGQCGSCWSFSTTGSMEGVNFIKTGKLVSLSEQELVDCSTSYGNQGCNGGLMDDAFKYIIANGGLGSEASYPYTAADGTCKKVASVASISGYTDVKQSDEDALQAAVAQQPVSVAIEADQLGFQFYSSGVFSGACGTQLDHGVLVVGYGSESGKDYWKVKNSWGATWGSSGYINLARGTGSGKPGQCGVAMQPSYPTKSGAAVAEPTVAPVAENVGDIWSSCAKAGDHLSGLAVTITPDPPVKGKSVTVSASGTLDETITAGSVDLTIDLLGIPVISKTYNICTDFPGKVSCPIAKGAFKLDVTEAIPSSVPSGAYTGKVTVADQAKSEVTCINLNLNL